MNAEEFLKSKGIIKEGFSEFVITYGDGTKIVVNDLLDEYANQSKWISVEDSLPETDESVGSGNLSIDVLGLTYYGCVECYYNARTMQWNCEYDSGIPVTHWQTLPTFNEK